MKSSERLIKFFAFSAENDTISANLRKILQAMVDVYCPVRFGFEDPTKEEFKSSEIDDLVSRFKGASLFDTLILDGSSEAFSFLLGRGPNFDGLWYMSGSFRIDLMTDSFESDLLFFADNIALSISATYAQISNSFTPGWKTPFDLRVRLPDIPCVSYYGRQYIDLFGEERLSSAPFVKAVELSPDCMRLHATGSVFDPVDVATKDRIRNYLGEKAFMKHPKWRYRNGISPWRDG